MIKIALCDDEAKILDEVSSYINKYAEKKSNQRIEISRFDSAKALDFALDESSFDIFVLDVYIGEEMGTALARSIRKRGIESPIIFLTTSVEHGTDATAPEIPAKEGYNETAPKWDKDGKSITADTVINAVYTKNQPGEYADVTPDTNVGGGKITEKIEKLKEKVPFTLEEKLQIEYGADVEIWLEIKDISDSVSSEDKAKVEEKQGDADVALYLNIAMFKQVGENEASLLTQLSDRVQIAFKLVDSYINTDEDVTRTYSIIHVHDGKAEVITPVFDAATKTLTFETDRFSTYAVVYTDVENVPPTPPVDTPATGDSFQPAFWIACMTLSIFGIAVLLLDAQRRHAR